MLPLLPSKFSIGSFKQGRRVPSLRALTFVPSHCASTSHVEAAIHTAALMAAMSPKSGDNNKADVTAERD